MPARMDPTARAQLPPDAPTCARSRVKCPVFDRKNGESFSTGALVGPGVHSPACSPQQRAHRPVQPRAGRPAEPVDRLDARGCRVQGAGRQAARHRRPARTAPAQCGGVRTRAHRSCHQQRGRVGHAGRAHACRGAQRRARGCARRRAGLRTISAALLGHATRHAHCHRRSARAPARPARIGLHRHGAVGRSGCGDGAHPEPARAESVEHRAEPARRTFRTPARCCTGAAPADR